jgi:hypothetical protein
MHYFGSRSTIKDPITLQVYPLFDKGSNSFPFEYGVYLLNKCIAEILNSRGIPVLELQMTLSNLRMLLESLKNIGNEARKYDQQEFPMDVLPSFRYETVFFYFSQLE